jgi:hypothetical protein
VQAVFNAPIIAEQLKQTLRTGLLWRKAGQAIDHLAGLALVFPDFPLDPENLSDVRPVEVVIEVGTDQDGAFLDATMAYIVLVKT